MGVTLASIPVVRSNLTIYRTSKGTCPIVQVYVCPYLPRLLCFLSLPSLPYPPSLLYLPSLLYPYIVCCTYQVYCTYLVFGCYMPIQFVTPKQTYKCPSNAPIAFYLRVAKLSNIRLILSNRAYSVKIVVLQNSVILSAEIKQKQGFKSFVTIKKVFEKHNIVALSRIQTLHHLWFLV